MKKTMCITALASVLLTAVSIFAYSTWEAPVFQTLAITFGTVAYHFLMRLFVGYAFDICMKNRADYSRKWYQCRRWEGKLYKWLKVKKWKGKLPSYNGADFDPGKHSWSEIAQAMCQAELVHEVIAVLSFVPILFSCWFGQLLIFAITSLCAAAFDMLFVIMQRYNRPRIIRLIQKAV